MKKELSLKTIEELHIIVNETSERDFAFALKDELKKIGIEDEEVEKLTYLYWKIEDLTYKLRKKYLKRVDNY